MISALDLARTGIELQLQGDIGGARLHYLAALQADKLCLPALQNLAQIANDANELNTSLAFTRRILALRPYDAAQWSNVGNTLTRLERFDEAYAALGRAVELGPELVSAWHNLALLHLRRRVPGAALQCIEKVERLGSRGLGVQNDKAHMLLALGRLEEALPLYEARWATLRHLPPWDFHIPEWQGESLEGKSIIVHAEQGFGDTLLWLRFAPELVGRGAELTIGVPRCMVSLVEYMDLTALSIEDMNEENMREFDFQSPMFSTLRWLGVSKGDIHPDPYLFFPFPEACEGLVKVGICWASGRRGSEHDWRGRYTDLRDWLRLAELPHVELVSLQQGSDADDVERIQAEGLIDITPIRAAQDWLATARIIAGLDLVICVDTAVAHLAAAMDKPVWMLSQYSNCWRWWEIENNSGRPWYRSMRIFRQPTPGDWKSCLDECVALLERREENLEKAA